MITQRSPRKRVIDPLELVLCVSFGMSAMLQFKYPAPTGTTAATIDRGSLIMWLVLVSFGCAVTLLGMATPRVWGLQAEQVGLVAVGGALVAYGTQVVWFQWQHHILSPATISGGPLIMLLGIGLLWKMWQVKNALDALSQSQNGVSVYEHITRLHGTDQPSQ